jgi:hypothetical protein
MLTSCTEVSGTAKVRFFDSHVVAATSRAAATATANQIDFVDESRTIYKVGAATFTGQADPRQRHLRRRPRTRLP